MARFDSRPNSDDASTDDYADDSDGPRKTRRGFLARAGAIAALPAFVGGAADARDAVSTPAPDRVATSDPAGAQADIACASLAFERRYDPFSGGPGAELAELDGDGYAIVGASEAGELRVVRTDPQGEPRFTRTYDLGPAIDRVTGLVDTDDGFVALGGTADGCWFASVDTACNARWIREYDSDAGGCQSLVRTAEGGYAWVTGTSEGVPAAHVVDEQGETVWRRSYPFDFGEYPDLPAGNAELSTLVQREDGGFVLVGTARGGDLSQAPVWMIRTDAEGNRLDERLYGEAPSTSTLAWEFHRVFDAVRTADGGVAATGYFGDNPATTTSPETEFLFVTVGPDLELGTYGVTPTETEPLETCGDARGTEIVRTDDGFVVAGRANVCLPPDPADHAVAHFVGLASDGTVRWAYRYPEDYQERSSPSFDVDDAVLTVDGGVAGLGRGDGDEGPYNWLLKLTAEEQC